MEMESNHDFLAALKDAGDATRPTSRPPSSASPRPGSPPRNVQIRLAAIGEESNAGPRTAEELAEACTECARQCAMTQARSPLFIPTITTSSFLLANPFDSACECSRLCFLSCQPSLHYHLVRSAPPCLSLLGADCRYSL